MKQLARWAWMVVVGTALSLSWWSLDALARHYGVPALLAAVVSVTFDGAALVAADLAIRRAQAADSAGAVKLFMLAVVGLSAWLNYEHGALLHFPVPIRVLFASPPVISGSLFELQLKQWHRVRLRELGRIAEQLPRFGALIWVMRPLGALKKVNRIAASRLHSIPVTVIDWPGALNSVRLVTTMAGDSAVAPEAADIGQQLVAGEVDCEETTSDDAPARASRSPVPDELYLTKLREHVAEANGVIPSAREVGKLLSIGQDRARRLVQTLRAENVLLEPASRRISSYSMIGDE